MPAVAHAETLDRCWPFVPLTFRSRCVGATTVLEGHGIRHGVHFRPFTAPLLLAGSALPPFQSSTLPACSAAHGRLDGMGKDQTWLGRALMARKKVASSRPTKGLVDFSALFRVDPRSLAILRIMLGLLAMVDVARRIPYVDLIYSRNGILPNAVAVAHPFSSHVFTLLNGFDGTFEQGLFFWFILASAFLFTVGYRTRLFHFITAAGILSIHNYNILVENGGDQVQNIFLCWALFFPLGARWSIDSLRKSMRDTRERSPADLNNRALGAPNRTQVWSLAVLACLFQFAAIYFFNAVNKSGNLWGDGSALYYVAHMDRQVTWFALWAREHLPYAFWVFGSWGTLVLEIAIVLGALSVIWVTRMRMVAFFSIWILHVMIAIIMNVGVFSWAMICATPILLLPEHIEAFKRFMGRITGGPVHVFYDADCGICHGGMRLLKRLDRLERLTYAGPDWDGPAPPGLDALRDRTLVVWRAEDGRVWTRHQAVGRILLSLPFGFLFSWIAWIPLLGSVFGALYDAVARNRTRISQFLGQPACGLPTAANSGAENPASSTGSTSGRLGSLAVFGGRELLVLVLIFLSSYQMLSTNKWLTQITSIKQEGWMRATLRYPRMFQRWNMFAPNPPRGEGWLVVDACTADGRNIDPQSGKAPNFGPVDYHSGIDFGQMWRIYTKRIRKKSHSVRRGALRTYLSKRHRHLDLPSTDRLTSYNVYWIRHRSPTPDEWYRPIPRDHWLRSASQSVGGLFGKDAANVLERSLASWARWDVPETRDHVIFERAKEKTGRPVKPSCSMVTSHVSSAKAAKLPCKNALSPQPPSHCKPDKKSKRRNKKALKRGAKKLRTAVKDAKTSTPRTTTRPTTLDAIRTLKTPPPVEAPSRSRGVEIPKPAREGPDRP